MNDRIAQTEALLEILLDLVAERPEPSTTAIADVLRSWEAPSWEKFKTLVEARAREL